MTAMAADVGGSETHTGLEAGGSIPAAGFTFAAFVVADLHPTPMTGPSR